MSSGETSRPHLRRGAAAGVVGALAVAIVELVLSIALAQGKVSLPTGLRFAALDLTLVGLAALLAVPLSAGLYVLGVRLLGRGGDGPSRVPWVWAVALGVAAYVGGSFGLTLAFRRFREPILAALALAVLQLVLFAVLGGAVVLGGRLLGRAAARLDARLGRANPLGRAAPAAAALAAAVAAAAAVLLWRSPMLRAVVPVRELVSLAVFGVGFAIGLRLHARRGRLWPAEPRRRRVAVAAAVIAFVVLAPLTLWKIGADDESRYLALTASPTLSHIVDAVRRANDFDGDGYGTLLGENDCGPFDKDINPAARDIPDNGIDENCNGFDFSSASMAASRGERMPVPGPFRKRWNVLLITIDSLRYDKTGLGGYPARRHRDLTPNLDALARRGVWFTFANAPSAGTMAAVPSLLTSKFFHSGVAQKTPPGFIAPILLPENLTISDVVKRAGYLTGAIVTHDYFGSNGMQLAKDFDSFDISLGEKREPKKITSPEVTDKAQAWISARSPDQPWFLWVHYLDPHGVYMPHPGDASFGTSEEDLYDGEVAFTDKHLGRLLDFLSRSPHGKQTAIIITADHGEGFNEHGYINHGMTLYKELLHVPLLIYVPDVEPHSVDGPVSDLDILPTIADLAGVDVSQEAIEGESLTPQIFYARDSKQRTIFAETNYPEPIRAAVTQDYKLIYNLKANVYQLYDLRKDAWEKTNIWGRDAAGGTRMKRLLDEWLDRVFFNRAAGNEAEELRSRIVVKGKASPKTEVTAEIGALEAIGWDGPTGELKPNQPFAVTVYLRAKTRPAGNYRFEVEAQAGTTPPIRNEVIPANGLYPTSHWRTDEIIRLTFSLRIPGNWQPGPVSLRLRILDERRQPLPVTGPAADGGNRALLGSVPLVAAAAPG